MSLSHNHKISFFGKERNTQYLEIRNPDQSQQQKPKEEINTNYLESRNPAKQVYGNDHEINTQYLELPSLAQLENPVQGMVPKAKKSCVLDRKIVLEEQEERRAIIAKEKIQAITDAWSTYIAKPALDLQVLNEGYDSSEEEEDITPIMSPVNSAGNSPGKLSDEEASDEEAIDADAMDEEAIDEEAIETEVIKAKPGLGI